MTLLKQFATFVALFVILFVVTYFMIIFVGAAVCGGMAGAEHPHDAARAGAEAGRAFVENHLQAIVFSSSFFSFVASALLSFSGALPWCRARQLPPTY
jgi:hypothetical protein